MIIDRYIMREIIKPTVTICTVLILIFSCYMATRYWEDAVHGQELPNKEDAQEKEYKK